VAGAFPDGQGASLVVGGKTGSGDNRYKTFARGGAVRSSRAVSRTAAFAFFIGDRYVGVIAASVTGPEAGTYHFTSSLPVALLKLLAPAIGSRSRPPGSRKTISARTPRPEPDWLWVADQSTILESRRCPWAPDHRLARSCFELTARPA
jgi:hypothetical protein